MSTWLAFADPVRALLLALTHVTGGSMGGAILLLSCAVRVLLFPLALRLARHARDAESRLAAAAPELERLRARWAQDPARLFTETRRVHRAHGIRPVSGAALLNLAVQIPLGASVLRTLASGVARAARFLWIGDLARPDALLAVATAASAALVAALSPAPAGQAATSSSRGMVAVAAIMTLVFVWRMAAGVGLYWLGSNAASAVQAIALRRLVPREPRP